MARNSVQMPTSLDRVTAIDAAAEHAPESAGLQREAVEAIWQAVERLYRSGTQPMVALCVRREASVVLHRAIGHTRGNEPGSDQAPVPATPDTPVCLFSASKAITALLVHKTAELGLLRLDDPVARYLPEYGQKGKHATTVRALLAHRAHIPSVPLHSVDYRLLYDWDGMVDLLCRTEPFVRVGEKQAYHALTAGFILGELVRRVSGLSLQDALRLWLAEPLGCRHLTFGIAPEHRHLAAPNVFTGPKVPGLVDRLCEHVIGAGFEDVVRISNEPEFLSCPIPSANIFASADDAGRVFQMLLDGGVHEGRRVLGESTVREIITRVGRRQFDRTLLLPIRFSAGMMLGDCPVGLFGPNSRRSFGHVGFLNIVCWADPLRQLSVALLCNGKHVSPNGNLQIARLIAAICKHCPPLR